MVNTVKVLSTEIALSNSVGNTVNSAKMVRIINTNATTSEVVRLCYANGDVKATTTIGHKGTDFARFSLVKDPTDIILTSGAVVVRATSIAYT